MGLCSCLGTTLFWLVSLAFHGAVLALLGLALIYWTNWPAALAGSIVYLIVLLVLTGRYHSRVMADAATVATTTTKEDDECTPSEEEGRATDAPPSSSSTPSSSSRRRKAASPPPIPVGLSLLYLLTSIMIAVPGAITVFFAFPCGDIDPDMARKQVYYQTNLTELSPAVQSWVENFSIANAPSPTVAHSSTNVYVYGTTSASKDPQLYAIPAVGADPIALGYQGTVHDLVAATDSTVCFVHSSQGYTQSHITCGEYGRGFQDLELPRNRYSFGLTSIDGLLWFLQIRSDYYIFDPLHGGACNFNAVVECENCFIPACQPETMRIMSLNTTTMELVSHSTRYATRGVHNSPRQEEEGDSEENDVPDEAVDNQDSSTITDVDDEIEAILDSDMFCDGAMLTRLRALGALILSALPLVLYSTRTWIRYAIPSASVALFSAIAYGFFCAWGVFAPSLAPIGFRMWMVFGTPVWLLVCTYQVVVNPRVSKAPLWWSLYLITTGLVTLLVIQELFEFYNVRVMDGNEITVWLVDVIFVHFPLLVIAILTKSIYISLLAITAFLMLTSIVVWRMTDTMSSTMMVGGAAYACILVIAILLYCWRDSLHHRFVKTLSAIARHTCAIEVADEDKDETEDTEVLLTNEDNELL